MKKVVIACLLLVSLLSITVFAENVKIVNVTKTFSSGVAGTPRVVYDSAKDYWVVGDIDFSSLGKGFGIWIDKKSLKRREVTESGAFRCSSKSILNAVSVNAKLIQTGISFNESFNQFVGVWTNENQTVLVNLNGTTGSPEGSPSPIATSILDFSRNPTVSANSGGKTLVVWEDSTAAAGTTGPAKFQIRGAIID